MNGRCRALVLYGRRYPVLYAHAASITNRCRVSQRIGCQETHRLTNIVCARLIVSLTTPLRHRPLESAWYTRIACIRTSIETVRCVANNFHQTTLRAKAVETLALCAQAKTARSWLIAVWYTIAGVLARAHNTTVALRLSCADIALTARAYWALCAICLEG